MSHLSGGLGYVNNYKLSTVLKIWMLIIMVIGASLIFKEERQYVLRYAAWRTHQACKMTNVSVTNNFYEKLQFT